MVDHDVFNDHVVAAVAQIQLLQHGRWAACEGANRDRQTGGAGLTVQFELAAPGVAPPEEDAVARRKGVIVHTRQRCPGGGICGAGVGIVTTALVDEIGRQQIPPLEQFEAGKPTLLIAMPGHDALGKHGRDRNSAEFRQKRRRPKQV